MKELTIQTEYIILLQSPLCINTELYYEIFKKFNANVHETYYIKIIEEMVDMY